MHEQLERHKRNIWPWHMSERQFATFGCWTDMIDMFPIFTSTIYIYRTLIKLSSLKLTDKAPANGWLEDDRFLLGPGLFFGAFALLLVLGRVHLKAFHRCFTWKWWMVSKVGLSCFEGSLFKWTILNFSGVSNMTNPEISLKMIQKQNASLRFV